MHHYRTRIGIILAISALIISPFAVNALSPIKPKPKPKSKVKTSIVISPKTAKQGQKVKATLKGFAPNSRLSITIDTELSLTPYSFYSDKKGSGTITFTVPEPLPSDTYVLHATDVYNTLATTKLSVKGKQMSQILNLDPAQGIAGTVVTFSGEGWLKRHKTVSLKGYDDNDEEVLMDFEPDTIEDLCASQTCKEYEALVRVTIPQDAEVPEGEEEGIYELVFSDGYNSKTVEFTLVNKEMPPAQNTAKISLAVLAISLGNPLTISGTGFAPKSELSARVGTSSLSFDKKSSITDEYGSFKDALLELSALKPGSYTVTILDSEGNSAKAEFEIKSPLGGTIVGGGPEQGGVLPPTPAPTPMPTLTPQPSPTPLPEWIDNKNYDIQLTIIYPDNENPAGISYIYIIPEGENSSNASFERVSFPNKLDNNGILVRFGEEWGTFKQEKVSFGKKYDIYTGNGLTSNKIGSIDLTTNQKGPIDKTIDLRLTKPVTPSPTPIITPTPTPNQSPSPTPSPTPVLTPAPQKCNSLIPKYSQPNCIE